MQHEQMYRSNLKCISISTTAKFFVAISCMYQLAGLKIIFYTCFYNNLRTMKQVAEYVYIDVGTGTNILQRTKDNRKKYKAKI